MKKLINKSVHGDTIIEVMISLAIFSAVALLTINLMNSSINTAQTTLESTMARAALDAQAETLRFIHNSYVSERNRSGQDKQFSGLWKALISKGLNTESLSDRLLVQKALANLDIEDANNASCDQARRVDVDGGYAFVLNPRFVVPSYRNVADSKITYDVGGDSYSYDEILSEEFVVSDGDVLGNTTLYPRILYGEKSARVSSDSGLKTDESSYLRHIIKSEGIWDVMLYESDATGKKTPEHYDFYIHVCWNAPGAKRFSSITSIVRLHNPEQE